MIGMVLVTHGHLATEFRSALEHVVGPQKQLATITIGPEDDMEQRRKDIVDAVVSVESGDGVVVLTDMFGGTPTNISAMFLKEDEVEIVTGVNLPMVIKLATDTRPIGLKQMAADVEEEGKSAICRAGELLSPAKPK